MLDRKLSRRLISLSLGLLLALGSGISMFSVAEAGPSGREIMDKVATSRKLDGSEAVVTMSIMNDKGQTRERKIALATKLYDDGKTEKRIYRFLSPSDVKGTGVLVFDYDDKADDVWVFLPALRKTRRIVSSQRSQSFMGSEFSYADLNVPALDDYKYNVLKEEKVDGEACWVVEVLPKDEATGEDEGYSKKTYWISKASAAIHKGMFYDLDGKLLKELTASKIELLDKAKKRYRPLRMEMVNKQNGRRSIFDTEKIAFAPDTSDDNFTTRRLEQP